MNYEKKAQDKLKQIEGLIKDQQSEIKSASDDFLNKIQALPNDDPQKAKFNDIRNRILKAGAAKNKDELKKIIDELKNI